MPRRTLLSATILVLALLAIGWSRLATREPRGFRTWTEQIMASPISVTLPRAAGPDAAETVFAIFRAVDAEMSEWKPSSPLSAVNRAAGDHPVAVPVELRRLLRRGLEISAMTDGAFDVTWGALWGLWDFRADPPRRPDDESVSARAALVDYRLVRIDDEAGTVFLPQEGMLVGLGGIAKGYALDRAAAALRAGGVETFLISAAGQVMLGGHPDGRAWRVGVRDPRGARDDFFASLELTDLSVSTSGDYEQSFILDGTRYHHILDPRTGRPARGLRSATVVSPDATLADALSTAVMVLGVERGLELVERLPGTEALLVDDEAGVHATSGLAGAVREHHPPARGGP